VPAATLVMSFRKFLLLSEDVIIIDVDEAHRLEDTQDVAAGENASTPFPDSRMDAVSKLRRFMIAVVCISRSLFFALLYYCLLYSCEMSGDLWRWQGKHSKGLMTR